MNTTNPSPNPIQARRLAREWSQAELAQRVGISRAAVSAIEAERLSPSVATALELARVFDCSVEELFGHANCEVSTKPEWAWLPRSETCRYWEANVNSRRRLFPVEAVTLNPTSHDGVWQDGILRASKSSTAETTLVMACCDPASGRRDSASGRRSRQSRKRRI